MALPISLEPPSEYVELEDGRRVSLLELLGKGQISSVYRGAVDAPSGVRRAVAIKLFHDVATEEAEHVASVVRRAVRRTACIRHPNVVSVEDFGVTGGYPFVVQELVDGVTLEALMERHASRAQRMPLDLALFIATEMAEGLSGARTARDHAGFQLGVLHLALSPREVLLSFRGEVKVVDFELSRAQGATSSVRSIRAVATRARTMAPEVAQGDDGDARSDVFSLGVIIRELLVGPRFPAGASDADLIRLAQEGHIEPISFSPHLPAALLPVLSRALEVDPYRRFPNATAMVYELRRIVFGMGVGDGRWFLRRSLDHEWGNDALEATGEQHVPPGSTPSMRIWAGPSIGDELHLGALEGDWTDDDDEL